jgi:hypothetical protein
MQFTKDWKKRKGEPLKYRSWKGNEGVGRAD